jgi:hypothetical protein
MIALMAERAVIACCVTSETKARVRALAEREGITESTLVRQLLDTVLRTSTLGELPTPPPPEKVSRQARLYVRLAAEDWRLLRARASARGMASATYVALLTRSHLRGAAPITPPMSEGCVPKLPTHNATASAAAQHQPDFRFRAGSACR